MYLFALRKQNEALVEAVLTLHSKGELLPDSYIIDIEQFIDNARMIKQIADNLGINLYAMTKQFGRNPYLAKCLIELGYHGVVAVDFKEARCLHRNGINVSHIGHLVQPPECMLEEIIHVYQPEVITVYSLEKARSIAKLAQKVGRTQSILLKFYSSSDKLYINQESGFPLEKMKEIVNELVLLQGIRVVGITHFPCFLHDGEQLAPTENLTTLVRAKENWPVGVRLEQVNMPSATCCATLPLISEHGGTHAEPGHALTGTIPNNIDGSQPEKIAMLYLSEISHRFEQHSYCFAGGYYRRGNLENGLINGQVYTISNEDQASIDYHLKVAGSHDIGTPVIMAFRSQVFVTRSDVVLVDGVQSGCPRIVGRFSALGEAL